MRKNKITGTAKNVFKFILDILLGLAVLFAIWAFLWICNDLGYKM